MLAVEAACLSPSDSQWYEASRVLERLRASLVKFAGSDSYSALLQRALAKTRSEIPALGAVQVQTGGGLEGFEEYCDRAADKGAEAGVAITENLLGLLVDLVGEPLTRHLVRRAWPDLSHDDLRKIETP